jgi:hypothetical protein
MSVQVTLLCYGLLMLSLALMVRWEGVRRRKGPRLRSGDLDQFNSPRPSYTPPPDRSNRSLDPVRRR